MANGFARTAGSPGGLRPPFAVAVMATSAVLLFGASGGCMRYHVGNQTLFPSDIHTVYVPVFESDSFRPFLGERLTEAVVKEIEKQTPFKVVGSPDADSVLSGRIVGDGKKVLAENGLDEARQIEIGINARVSWVNRRGDVLRTYDVPLPPTLVDVSGTGNLVPEVGQSIATGQQLAIDQLATQIVGLMEVPW